MNERKTYAKPALVCHGSVETVTLGVKAFGETDGWVMVTGDGLATVS